jgi:hypothetical protein
MVGLARARIDGKLLMLCSQWIQSSPIARQCTPVPLPKKTDDNFARLTEELRSLGLVDAPA